MRKKLLFLTLAVVMLLAVLTISAGAVDLTTETAFWTLFDENNVEGVLKLDADYTLKYKGDPLFDKVNLTKDVTIDLNGYTLTFSNVRIMDSTNGGSYTLTITDTKGDGKINGVAGNTTMVTYFADVSKAQGWMDKLNELTLNKDCTGSKHTSSIVLPDKDGGTYTLKLNADVTTTGSITIPSSAVFNFNGKTFTPATAVLLCDEVDDISTTRLNSFPGAGAITLKLTQDISSDAAKTVLLPRDISVDLDGHTLTNVSFETRGFTLTTEDTLTVDDSTTAEDPWVVMNRDDLQQAVANNTLCAYVQLGADIEVGYSSYIPGFVASGSTTGSITLPEGKYIDLNGHYLKTDNLYIKSEIQNSVPSAGGILYGIRSGIFVDSSRTTDSLLNLAETYGYMSYVKEIAFLSGHFGDNLQTSTVYIPAGVSMKNYTVASTGFKASTTPRTPCCTKSFTLAPGAVLDTVKLFPEMLLTEGFFLECESTEDLLRAVPALVESATTTKGGKSGGILEYTYTITDDLALTENVSIPDGDVVLETGVTLDLTGRTLICKSIEATTGKVIDTVGGGKLIVSDGIANSFAGDNFGFLPLFDGEGYRFFRYSVIQRTTPVLEGELLKCMFRFEFTDANAYALLAAGNSGLTLNFDLNCANGTKSYRFSEDTLKAYGQAYVDNSEGHFAISVKLDGYAGSGNFSTEFSLQTEAGAAARAASNHQQTVVVSD